jgi:murein tripeptide amidase MpaA
LGKNKTIKLNPLFYTNKTIFTIIQIINELTTNSSAYSKILEEIDIYIIPMINVDGYEWSRTRDRMWR